MHVCMQRPTRDCKPLFSEGSTVLFGLAQDREVKHLPLGLGEVSLQGLSFSYAPLLQALGV